MNTTPYKLESFGISNIGLVRGNNEDVWAALPEKKFYILADGMGGHNAGEVASSLAMQSMCRSISTMEDHPNIKEACRRLRESISSTNTKVFYESHHNMEYAGMGTTLSCFVVIEDYLIYAHVGDSRLYRYRGKLKQLTEDHSLRNVKLAKEENAPPRNAITRAIGIQSTILPDIGVIPLRPRDIYMLCSDGLSDYVSESKIALILASPLSLEEMGKMLVEAALKKGGNDNITLLLVRVT